MGPSLLILPNSIFSRLLLGRIYRKKSQGSPRTVAAVVSTITPKTLLCYKISTSIVWGLCHNHFEAFSLLPYGYKPQPRNKPCFRNECGIGHNLDHHRGAARVTTGWVAFFVTTSRPDLHRCTFGKMRSWIGNNHVSFTKRYPI